MNILDNIKAYFNKKNKNESTDEAPEGVCPNCWGKQDWDGEFYKIIKANNITPESHRYTNFIHEVVKKLDKITLKKDTYTCETCKHSFKK